MLNELPMDKPVPRKFLKGKKSVKAYLDAEELKKEQSKSEKILEQI